MSLVNLNYVLKALTLLLSIIASLKKTISKALASLSKKVVYIFNLARIKAFNIVLILVNSNIVKGLNNYIKLIKDALANKKAALVIIYSSLTT